MKILLPFLVVIIMSACSNDETTTTINSGKSQPIGNKCPEGYPVKGNLTSKTGDMIYHSPGQDYYNKTIPEECFKTKEDAEKAGYRKSKR